MGTFDIKCQARWDDIQRKKQEKDEVLPYKEEWIWVEGFKGTDKDMVCRDYRFALNEKYDMPKGEDIRICASGFHFCLDLPSVFKHYPIGKGNRFFRVNALVRKADYDNTVGTRDTKLASKSIIFTSELTDDEVLTGEHYAEYTAAEKSMIRTFGEKCVIRFRQINALHKAGYSVPFAEYLVDTDRFEIAIQVGSQEGLSMDMKVLLILNRPSVSNLFSRNNVASAHPSVAIPALSQDTIDSMKKISDSLYASYGIPSSVMKG